MNTATAARTVRWTRVLNGWYSANIVTDTAYISITVTKTDLGFWAVEVNDQDLGLCETLKAAKAVALAAVDA